MASGGRSGDGMCEVSQMRCLNCLATRCTCFQACNGRGHEVTGAPRFPMCTAPQLLLATGTSSRYVSCGCSHSTGQHRCTQADTQYIVCVGLPSKTLLWPESQHACQASHAPDHPMTMGSSRMQPPTSWLQFNCANRTRMCLKCKRSQSWNAVFTVHNCVLHSYLRTLFRI